MEITIPKRIAFSIVTMIAVFGLLETAARVFYRPSDDSVYDEHRNIIDILGLPQLNETMEFDHELFWRLRPNLVEHRVQGKMRETPVDFMVSTNSLGLRNGEVGEKEGRYRVLAVGNSCTFGLGVANEMTWPAQLERVMNRTLGRGAEVINAGVPGYTSFQGLQYLEANGLALEPDLVIVSFGFNDSDRWSSRTDSETARALHIGRAGRLFEWSRLYLGLKAILSRIGGKQDQGEKSPLPESTTGSRPPDEREIRHPRLLPAEFRETMLAIHDVCAERSIPVIYIVWPYRNQVLRSETDLIVYQPIIRSVAVEAGAPVVELIAPFIGAANEPFLDHIHATPFGCRLVAETIGNLLERARTR